MVEFLTSETKAIGALLIVFMMFVGFLLERWPTEVVAISGAALMLSTGILPYQAGLQVLSNPAPWTIAVMFILMGALVRTGSLAAFSGTIQKRAEGKPGLAVLMLLIFVAVTSAFMSNTPVVLVMIPVVVGLAKQLGLSASKLLIPLSYAAILGGTLTLIGTSTNLLVDGVAQDLGLEAFSIFELTPLGIVLVIWGMIYLRIIAPRLLPDRTSLTDALTDSSKRRFLTEAVVPSVSSWVDRNVTEIEDFRRAGVRLVDVVRNKRSLRRELAKVQLEGGDTVVFRCRMDELLSFQENEKLRLAGQGSERETQTVEVLIGPLARIIGKKIGDLRLRRRFGVYVLAVHRKGENVSAMIDEISLRPGDTVLVEGEAGDIRRAAEELSLTHITQPTERAYRRSKAPVALLALAGVVGLAALGVAPLLLLSIVAVALVFLFGAIDSEEAFELIEGRLIALIFAMLCVGAGLNESGAVRILATGAAPFLIGLSPFFLVWAVYLLTSLLTELVSNNAVAVVVTPVAVGLAAQVGVDPRPLVVAVMVAASASFATPIGYQTNMMVYGPGGYRFKDFLKVGVPLNLSIGIIASAIIPLIWPL